MGNVRVLTGGLVLIALGLAGGTGYLIYDNIQSELGGKKRVTHDDLEVTRNEIKKTQDDVLDLRERQALHTAKIATLEIQTAEHQVRIDGAERTIKQLEQQTGDNARAIEEAKRERDQLRKQQQDLQGQLDDHQSQLEGVNKRLKEMGERVQELEARVSENESRMDHSDRRLDDLEAENARLRADLEEIKRQLGIGLPPPEN